MHIAFGAAPSRLCSQTPSSLSRPHSHLPSNPSYISVLPNSSLYVCPTILIPLPSLRGQCKSVLSCIQHEMSLPPSLLLLHNLFIDMPIFAFLYLSLSFLFLAFSPQTIYLCHINRISPLYALASSFPFPSNYPPTYFSRCRVL